MAAVVDEIRQRVRARYEKNVEGLEGFGLPSLTSLGQARDAAEGKVASIGTVNPRPPGLINSLVQTAKKLVARGFAWHVREQVEFNRALVVFMDQALNVMDEQNRHLLMLGRLAGGFEDLRNSWTNWRIGWEEKFTKSEIQFLRSVSELQAGFQHRAGSQHTEYLAALDRTTQEMQKLQAAFQHRAGLLESSFREQVQSQHADYLAALDRTTQEMQKRLWEDLAKFKQEQERLIHSELRLIRQRAQAWLEANLADLPAKPRGRPPAAAQGGRPTLRFDTQRFAERFRGSEAYVAAGQQFYLPYFQGRHHVVDLGCGRGEFLEFLKANGIQAQGVDWDPDSVSFCRQKGLDAAQGDLFENLAGLPDASLDGIFCAHVVEHLPVERVPDLVCLASRKLETGGVLAIETPNPECLVIFATNFYLDPTHVRPVPSAQLHFYMEENGFGAIEAHQRAPAAEVLPEIAELARVPGLAAFQKRFFGGLDYAIIGRRL